MNVVELTETMKLDFKNTYLEIKEQYLRDTANINDPNFIKNTISDLDSRYKNYKIFAEELQRKILFEKWTPSVHKVIFKNSYKIADTLLKRLLIIYKKNFRNINTESRRIILSGIKEEHELFIQNVKKLEKNLKGGS